MKRRRQYSSVFTLKIPWSIETQQHIYFLEKKDLMKNTHVHTHWPTIFSKVK
jgi:hypothetical protein